MTEGEAKEKIESSRLIPISADEVQKLTELLV